MPKSLFRLCFCLTLVFCLSLGQFSLIGVSSDKIDRLVNQGVELYAQGDYASAVKTWKQALTQYQQGDNLAQEIIVRENLARVYQQLGLIEQAIAQWEILISYHQQQGNQQKLSNLLIEKAQAYNYLGQSKDAIAILCGQLAQDHFPSSVTLKIQNCLPKTAIALAQAAKDNRGEASAWGSLGEAYRLQGNYQQALIYLHNSQKIAKQHNLVAHLMAANNSLGNVYTSLATVASRRANSAQQAGDLQEAQQLKQEAIANDRQALNYYQQSLEIARATDNELAQMNSLLNIITLEYRQGTLGDGAMESALHLLPDLPETQAKVYATIKLVKLLQPNINTPTDCLELSWHPLATKLLTNSLALAQTIQDVRGESFLLGELGHLAECRFQVTQKDEDYQQGLELTQQARWAAEQKLQAPDSLYLWEWQTGRLLLAQGKTNEALAAYTRAINALETIRDDLLSANRDLQYDFRDRIEPIYRQLINLKLEQVILPRPSQQKLYSVLNNFEKLKIAELQDYLGDNCNLSVFKTRNINFKPQNKGTAFFYSIIFPERTALIVNFPDGSQQIQWLNLDRTTLSQEINQFRIGLESYFDEQYDTTKAETIYQWLIAPFANQLKKTATNTLVFIHDGILRSVPMAALHNGHQFLIEEYAIATTPSLSLTPTTLIQTQKLKALAVGVTQSITLTDGSQFVSLPNVAHEIDIVQTQLPNTTTLLDREFNLSRLQQELTLNQYPILHIATHGEFSQEPTATFLVTGDEQKITINDLDNILRNISPVEVLVLTACQTAIGDERSALGLAGVAIQAGVSTALASLWSISDSKTPEIIEQFYIGLKNDQLSKAQALQKAQVNLIAKGNHPGFWASFIIIGNGM